MRWTKIKEKTGILKEKMKNLWRIRGKKKPLTIEQKYGNALKAINATDEQIREIGKQTHRVRDRRKKVETAGRKFDSKTDPIAQDAQEIITELLGKERAGLFFKICNE